MSNTAVGPVYKRVIDAVIEASRNDFEESGVSTAVLESMREKWQNRLSNADRADFLWDHDPENAAHMKLEKPDRFEKLERGLGHNAVYSNGQINGNDSTYVKQEPLDSGFLTLPPRGQTSGLGSQYASQRAAHLMQQQFGSQANGSIGALHAAQVNARQPQSQPVRQQSLPQFPQQSPYQSHSVPVEVQNREPLIKEELQDKTVSNAQHDGACELLTHGDAVARINLSDHVHEVRQTFKSNHIVRRLHDRSLKRLEGGGLMLPLEERPLTQRGRDQRLEKLFATSNTPPDIGTTAHTDLCRGKSLCLGGDMADEGDDNEVDDDAINSDLDDPDETADTTQEGSYDGDVILCLYDKVQRVKNKWKCVLRDGILTIDGKDYIFHKASGEFEW